MCIRDRAGHADWVRWLKDGTVDATSCTYGFVFSKEMNNKKLSDEDFVKTLYNLFMDREGEATGVAFWTKYLKDGHSRLEVFNGFTDSVESVSYTHLILAGVLAVKWTRAALILTTAASGGASVMRTLMVTEGVAQAVNASAPLSAALLAAAVALGVLGAVVQFRTTRPKT